LVWAVIKGYSVERAPTFRGAAGPAWPGGLATGVSSLYAAVILVTLAVVVGAAYVAWVMGVLGSIWGSPELLYIYPNSSLTYNDTSPSWVLKLYVENRGSAPSEILGVRLSGLECPIGGAIVLRPGDRAVIECTPSGVNPGAEYDAKIYTRAGNIFTTRVRASVHG